MIRLEEFVAAVQSAVSSATEIVSNKNLELFEKYFEEVTDGDELAGVINSSISAAERAMESGEDDEAQAQLRDAANALASAANRLARQRGETGPAENNVAVFAPKRVVIQYPHIGPGGKPTVKNVQVPLLTLVPMGTPEISEVRLRADLEMSAEEGGYINVSFAPLGDAGEKTEAQVSAASGHGSVATIDITVSGRRSADGLLKIVEGYEKALRAQIPG